MNSFVFHVPTKIYFGPKELNHIGEEVSRYGKRTLLVYGGGSIKKIGAYQTACTQLQASGVEIFELSGVEPNPRIESVRQGAQLCKEKNIDVVLAIGGGSAIDCAKFICAGAVSEEDPWTWFIDHNKKITKALPLVSVLTLAATGSEMDNCGVITNLSTHQKLGLGSDVLLPKASFLNPEYTYTVSAFQTAAGSADIMSHTMETYFTQEHDLYFLHTFMEGLLRTVIKFAPVAIQDPTNYEARANLMWASSWAINGFGNGGKTNAWSVHSIEHELSAYYDITHGLGLAILTPAWMRYCLQQDESGTLPKLDQFAQNVFGVTDVNLSPKARAEAGIQALQDFFTNSLQLAPDLAHIDIDSMHFNAMAKAACGQDGKIDGFVPLVPNDIKRIYEMCLHA